jgi:UDP-N-acetyl-D-galactosamine dehydrogenase
MGGQMESPEFVTILVRIFSANQNIRMKEVISVIGLGYVGLPVAVEFGRKGQVIGFDINEARLTELRAGRDHTGEVSASDLGATKIKYTSSVEDLKAATFHIVTVPTPVDNAHRPDMSIVIKATASVGRALKKGDIVVYESTVYPGATEEECVPVLEKESGLKLGLDFKVGYSPERINPGDKEHTFSKIKKVVSGSDAEALERVARAYESVVTAGVFRASSVKVAEAAKVIENTQRDLNIALINELALIFHRMDIDTTEVLQAAGTKWNFLPFKPGLVGGHCIGMDPYYLTHKAEQLGYIPQVILAGRRINDDMGKYVAQNAVKQMVLAGHKVRDCKILVLGMTFKEDCPDIRNSRVIDVVRELESFGAEVLVYDPIADANETWHEYQVKLAQPGQWGKVQAVVAAVAHKQFRQMGAAQLREILAPDGVLVDVKGMFDPQQLKSMNIRCWRL